MVTVHNSREENLQILRFVAAALVLVTHITFYIRERVNHSFDIWNGGEIGVPIFFIISGFVMYISGARLEKNIEGAKYFIRRRIARVFPLYWLMTTLKIVLAFLVPAAVLHNRPDVLNVLGSYALFPMFNAEGDIRPLHGVGWTLLHEMLFYYIFSLSLVFRRTPIIFSSCVITVLWLLGFLFSFNSALWRICVSELNLLFVVGMLLAAAYKNGFKVPKISACVLLLIGLLMFLSKDFRALQHHYIGSFNIGAILIVTALLSLQFTVLPKLKILLIKLGDSSYSLYMTHPILAPAICLILYKLHITSPYLILLIAMMICLFAGHFIYKFIEKPLNARATKFLENRIK